MATTCIPIMDRTVRICTGPAAGTSGRSYGVICPDCGVVVPVEGAPMATYVPAHVAGVAPQAAV